MYTGGVFPTSTKKRKHHSINFEKPTGPGFNPAAPAPNKFLQNYRTNLADVYMQKYGLLCNHLPATMPNLNLFLNEKNRVNAVKTVKLGHVNKRGSFNRSENGPEENVTRAYKIAPQKTTSIQMWDSSYYIPPNFGQKSSKQIASAPPVLDRQKTNSKSSKSKEPKKPESKTETINKNSSLPQQQKATNKTEINKSAQEKKTNDKSAKTNNEKVQNVDNKQDTQQGQSADVTKNVKNVNSPPKENTTSSSDKKSSQITEIYKRPEDEKLHGDSDPNIQNPPKIDSPSLQEVTQDLSKIIKNLQKQIQEVSSNSKTPMEEVPSSMIAPKDKEFFKKSPQTEPVNNQKPKAIPPKVINVANNNNVKRDNIPKNKSQELSSLRSVKPSVTSAISRKYSSSTQNSLVKKASTSTKSSYHSCTLVVDPLKVLKDEVQRAIREHKTFTIFGRYPAIRKALRERGWVEKFHGTYKNHLPEDLKKYTNFTINELLPLLKQDSLAELCRHLIKSKMLGGYQVDFYWAFHADAFKETSDKIKITTVNKLKRDIFSYTNKQGLCDSNKFSYWYQKPGVSKLNHPRTYSLAAQSCDVKEFIDDFNMTAAMSLLKWVVKVNITKESKLISPTGKVPLETFDFALNECCKFIKRANHEDIDMYIPDASSHDWEQFIEYYYKILHYSNHFQTGNKATDDDTLVRKSNFVLNNLKEIYPYLDMDGMLNIWIMKPAASCMGKGIHLCRTLQYALKVVKEKPNTRYIIQKYIERPLLIYNTKFDIRQWFLISNCSPLTIWMYKDCYLRFSSQTYNLRKLHESIHLTNNSVQSKYKTNTADAVLPNYNMWDSNEFKKYLANIGYPNVYANIIYPGMKQCIIAAILMHQDKMIVRRNCFELYGADFILSEDFTPWMLEINSNPAMHASTPITARMCPKVQEDVIKVVIDYARNMKANTGQFEMIYKQQVTKLPEVKSLEVKGKPLKKDYFYHTREEEAKSCNKNSYQNSVLLEQKQKSLKIFGEEIKKTLKNLLDIIHKEKQKRSASKK